MYRSIIAFVLVFLLTGTAVFAQEGSWQTSEDGTIEFNCDTLDEVLEALNEGQNAIDDVIDSPFARFDGNTVSATEYIGMIALLLFAKDDEAEFGSDDVFAPAMEACANVSGNAGTANANVADADTFDVIVNGDVNLRSCAGTECSVVGRAANGSLLTVLAVEGDWYQVETEDGTAYIAAWLTSRGPDAIISVDEAYLDPKTGCIIAFDIKRGDMDMNLILSGSDRGRVVADLYRPNETAPVRVEGQLDKTFIDTGDPYIHQYYSWNAWWPNGVYQLEVTRDGETSRLAWELETQGDYNIFVYCE